MVDANRRHRRHAEKLCGFHPAVAGNDHPFRINQDRLDESKILDGFRELVDLLGGMSTRVVFIRG